MIAIRERAATLLASANKSTDNALHAYSNPPEDVFVGAKIFGHNCVALCNTINDLSALLREAVAEPACAVPDAIRKIGEALNADRYDNDHCTAYPIFTVEKKRYVTGIDTDFTEQIGWFCDESDGGKGPVESTLAAELEEEYDRTDKCREGYTRTGYAIEWRHVSSYFTKPAAEAFIAAKCHEGEMRVYVDSAYRNHEWKAAQAFFMSLVAVPKL